MTDPASTNQAATSPKHTAETVRSITNGMSEPLLTENLKTLRVLHQLLLVVSAAILVFALRVDMSKDYKAALDELRAVKELDFAKWVVFVRDRYSDEQSQNDKFVREIVRLAGLPLQGKPSLNEPVFGDEARSGTLLQLDAFLSANQKIGILKLIGDKRVAAEQLKHAVASRNSHPVVIGMWLSGFEGGYGQQMLDWRNPPMVPATTV